MEKDLVIALLDEIVKYCDTIKQIKDNSNRHTELRNILKSNYEISSLEISNFIEKLNNLGTATPNKEIEKLDEKIINLCKIVNISYKEKDSDSDSLNYSKIRRRVSYMRQSIKIRDKKSKEGKIITLNQKMTFNLE